MRSGSRWLPGLAAAIAQLLVSAAGYAAEPPPATARPSQSPAYEIDRSGKGGVLCVWGIYVTIEAVAERCALPDAPGTAAIREAIAEMDEFILKNSSVIRDRDALEAFRRKIQREALSGAPASGACDLDPEILGFVDILRRAPPARIRTEIAELLSLPREPTMNPCL